MSMANQTIQGGQPLLLTDSEQVQACCVIAREKLEIGDYDAGISALQPWWDMGHWPVHLGLPPEAAAELLLVAGMLSSAIASTQRLEAGQKPAEALLSGAIALFEQIGQNTRALEAKIELAGCYFWEGLFDLARRTVQTSLDAIGPQS